MPKLVPDRHALVAAHRRLKLIEPLETVRRHPTLRIVLENRARYLMQKPVRLDVKKLQANDNDE